MECPRCKSRIKRLRTVDAGNMVTRYNGCYKCGERIKTVELYALDHERDRLNSIRQLVAAKRQAEQLSLNLDAIRNAFTCIHNAIMTHDSDQDEQAAALPSGRARISPYRYIKP